MPHIHSNKRMSATVVVLTSFVTTLRGQPDHCGPCPYQANMLVYSHYIVVLQGIKFVLMKNSFYVYN